MLLEETCPYLDNYGCSRIQIESFLSAKETFLHRQKMAMEIIERIMVVHNKQDLLRCVVELARVEHGTQKLEPQARDHVVHALLSFILGIYLNENLADISVNAFQWKLAGLFHDVGYPVQIAKETLLHPFAGKVNEIRKELGFRESVFFKVEPVGFEKLNNGVNAIDLIQDRLDDWHLKIVAREEFDQMIESGSVCHGIISTLAVLHVIDLLYQKFNPRREYRDIFVGRSRNVNVNQRFFEGDVVSACSAIFIHNLPAKCFANSKIDRGNAPVAFLLKLSDCLQEWDRPSLKVSEGFLASHFSMCSEKNEIVFKMQTGGNPLMQSQKEWMIETLSFSLIAPDVKIH